MLLRVPHYYKEFQCIADRCKDSCCIGWEIDIDEETLAYYNQVEGEFGERLRTNIKHGKENSFTLQQKRCPFLNETNLCDICIELGETSLCEICTEYPRFTLEVGTVREKCLGLSCEEAARLIFENDTKFTMDETKLCDEEEDDEDIIRMTKARDHAFQILQMRALSMDERVLLLLEFSEEVQADLNEFELIHIDSIISRYIESNGLSCANEFDDKESHSSKLEYFKERFACFMELEVLDKEWHTYTRKIKAFLNEYSEEEYASAMKKFLTEYKEREYEYEHLLCYFIFRYGLRAAYDSNFLDKIKFAVVSFFMIRDMDLIRYLENANTFTKADRIDVARIYSKEVEHSEDNMEDLFESFLFEETFATRELQKQLFIGENVAGFTTV